MAEHDLEAITAELLELPPEAGEDDLSPELYDLVADHEAQVQEEPDGQDNAQVTDSGAVEGEGEEERAEAIDPEHLRGSVSGLSEQHAKEAVNAAIQAAVLGLRHAPAIHYTQGGSRWEGINAVKVAAHGQYPSYADCSSYVSWCFWNGLTQRGVAHSDLVNGLAWRAGYTGTMLRHGAVVGAPVPGDAIIYGAGWPGGHTALYTGGGLVVSHGSEGGPYLLPWRYRSDVLSIRRYI